MFLVMLVEQTLDCDERWAASKQRSVKLSGPLRSSLVMVSPELDDSTGCFLKD